MSETRGPRPPAPSPLDAAIDAVLHDMVAGEGPADLHRRVAARLAERPSPSPWRAWPVLAAAAGIAVVAASLVLVRRASTPTRSVTSVHEPPVGSAAEPRTAAPAPTVQARAESVPPVPAPPRARRPARMRVSEPAPEPADGVEVAPIEVSPLDVAAMGDERVVLTPLRIERMDIEPLAEPQP